MKRISFLFISSFFLSSLISSYINGAYAADFIANCDSRVIAQAECISWLEQTLATLGCSNKDTRCYSRPWGSDFTKSWICSSVSSECQPSVQKKCPEGTYRTFVNGIEACKKSKETPRHFRGDCEHENTSHSAEVKSCDEGVTVCAKMGGVPEHCIAPDESPNSLVVSCHFPNITIPIQGTSCEEIRAKCELINTDKGARGRLLSCLAKDSL